LLDVPASAFNRRALAPWGQRTSLRAVMGAFTDVARFQAPTARPGGTARRHGPTARPDSTARQHGPTVRPDGAAR